MYALHKPMLEILAKASKQASKRLARSLHTLYPPKLSGPDQHGTVRPIRRTERLARNVARRTYMYR